MIFELKFECLHPQERLGFLLSQALKDEELDYSLFENQEGLFLWIDCTAVSTDQLEQIMQKLSEQIPQSLFVLDISSRLLEKEDLPHSKDFQSSKSFAYCPQCLKTKKGDICLLCQKKISNLLEIETIASLLLEGKAVSLNTQSGEHCLSLTPSPRVYCLNPEYVLEICHLTPKELEALASDEKPILRVRTNADFGLDTREICLSLAHDLELLELFVILRERGVKFLFETQEADCEFYLSDTLASPQELIILENNHPLLLRSSFIDSHLEEIFGQYQSLDKAYLATILEENQVHHQNILNFYFSLKGGDKICLYNAQTQWFNEVMEFCLPKDLFSLFEQIKQDGESGAKLLNNYKQTFPALCENNQSFESFPQGVFGIWEIARVVLGMEENPLYLANKNLNHRGVAIDYKFKQTSLIAQEFDLVKCIRSAMSFKLAGVQEEIIALGYIESFSLFLSKLYLALRQSVEIEGMSICGDLFASKMLGDFIYKNNRQLPIYRNITFPLLYQ